MLQRVKDGDLVYYRPILRAAEKFPAVVDGEMFSLGGGQAVVHIRDLPPEYGAFVGVPGKTRVHAASIEALELLVE